MGDLSCITNRDLGKVDVDKVRLQKTKFCNMVVSNAKRDKKCEEFFISCQNIKKLIQEEDILTILGGPVPDKLEFIKDYKFTMSFENSSYPGYTTEKIIETMFVMSIPVYWGNPSIAIEFNPGSFIKQHDFKNVDEAIRTIFMEIIENRNNFIPVAGTWRYYPQYIIAKLKDACVFLLKNMNFRII